VKPKFVDVNLRAFQAGREQAAGLRSEGVPCNIGGRTQPTEGLAPSGGFWHEEAHVAVSLESVSRRREFRAGFGACLGG